MSDRQFEGEGSAALHRLLQEALSDESKRLEALEERVRRLRSAQDTARREPPRPAAPEGDTVSESEIEAARRLLAESGRQLRELEERLLDLDPEELERAVDPEELERTVDMDLAPPAPAYRPPLFDSSGELDRPANGRAAHEDDRPALRAPRFDADDGGSGGTSSEEAFTPRTPSRRLARPTFDDDGDDPGERAPDSGAFRRPSHVPDELPASPRGFAPHFDEDGGLDLRAEQGEPEPEPAPYEVDLGPGPGSYRIPTDALAEEPPAPRGFVPPRFDAEGGGRADERAAYPTEPAPEAQPAPRYRPPRFDLGEEEEERDAPQPSAEDPAERPAPRGFRPPHFDGESGDSEPPTRDTAPRASRLPTRRLDKETTERFTVDRAFGEGNPPDWKRLLRQQEQTLSLLEQLREALLPTAPSAGPGEEERRALVARAEQAERSCAEALQLLGERAARLDALTAHVRELERELDEARTGAARQLVELLRSGPRRR